MPKTISRVRQSIAKCCTITIIIITTTQLNHHRHHHHHQDQHWVMSVLIFSSNGASKLHKMNLPSALIFLMWPRELIMKSIILMKATTMMVVFCYFVQIPIVILEFWKDYLSQNNTRLLAQTQEEVEAGSMSQNTWEYNLSNYLKKYKQINNINNNNKDDNNNSSNIHISTTTTSVATSAYQQQHQLQ